MNYLAVDVVKMAGAGNTFVFIDASAESKWSKIEPLIKISRSKIATAICHSVSGICADGCIFISQGHKPNDFEWDFYNSDGSYAEMCGNAARCAARFIQEYMDPTRQTQIQIKTGAGPVKTNIMGDKMVTVKMPPCAMMRSNIELQFGDGTKQEFDLVNSGVPHLVKEIEDFKMIGSLKECASRARAHYDLGPSGANVTFYSVEGTGKLRAVTFERGVEDFTLACGTGAVAAAFVFRNKSSLSDISVEMPGGMLEVIFNQSDLQPILKGEAVFVGEFKFNIEAIL